MIDIRFGSNTEYDILSNLAHKPFVFDGCQARSVEGILQSVKVQDSIEQAKFWAMFGAQAKKYGKNIPWQRTQILWWRGRPMEREGEEYQDFLDRLYSQVWAQSRPFREALNKSKGQVLVHSIGYHDPTRTILTQDEFISRLEALRLM